MCRIKHSTVVSDKKGNYVHTCLGPQHQTFDLGEHNAVFSTQYPVVKNRLAALKENFGNCSFNKGRRKRGLRMKCYVCFKMKKKKGQILKFDPLVEYYVPAQFSLKKKIKM